MTRSMVRVQKNRDITLPMWVIWRLRLRAGDFVQMEEVPGGVMLKPGKIIDPSQAYFWTKEWQAGEQEAETDIRKGRVKALKNLKKLIKDLNV